MCIAARCAYQPWRASSANYPETHARKARCDTSAVILPNVQLPRSHILREHHPRRTSLAAHNGFASRRKPTEYRVVLLNCAPAPCARVANRYLASEVPDLQWPAQKRAANRDLTRLGDD